MRAVFLTSIFLSVTGMAGAEGEQRMISIPVEAPGEKSIKDVFSKGFGTLRIIYSADKKHVVFAHDRGSGVVLEDTYAYEKREDKWVLIGMARGSSRTCSGISVSDGIVDVLDKKKEVIARFRLR